MAEEFTPEASVDFEALAAELGVGEPPPDVSGPTAEQNRQNTARPAPNPLNNGARRSSQTAEQMDPFAALSKLVVDQDLTTRELGQINTKLTAIQLQTIMMFAGALLLAVVVYKYARRTDG